MNLFKTSSTESLPLGAPAPQLTANNQDGETINFNDVYAKGITLVYFYPKASTPGCTAEACSLRDASRSSITTLHDQEGKEIQILGVSRDTPKAQKKFQQKYELPFALIADEDGSVAKAFGVKLNPLTGMASRQSFLIKEGKIVWSALKAQTQGASEEIQKALDIL
ncbi:MAG TPA: peroxiredoxin [Chthoniobacterales bacterium]|nr:peroxiredoxin [Chthoniobacterales bacterium]